MGAPPVFRGGFEVHLNSSRVDVQQCLTTRAPEQSLACLSPLPFVGRWSEHFTDQVSHLWLEVDAVSPNQVSYFVAISKDSNRAQLCSDFFETEWPKGLSELLNSDRVSYLGSMASRAGTPLRIHLKLSKDTLGEVLTDYGWPGSRSLLQDALKEIEFCEKLTACLEVENGALSPKLGLEAAPEDSDWERACRFGRDSGWLSPEDHQLVTEWNSSLGARNSYLPLPLLQSVLSQPKSLVFIERNASHFKWNLNTDDTIARKLYLWFGQSSAAPELVSTQNSENSEKAPPTPKELLQSLLDSENWNLKKLAQLEDDWGEKSLQEAFRVVQTMRLLRFAGSGFRPSTSPMMTGKGD